MAQEIALGQNYGSSIVHVVEVFRNTVERRYRHITTGEVYTKMEDVVEYVPVCSSGKYYINATKMNSTTYQVTWTEEATCKRCAKSLRIPA